MFSHNPKFVRDVAFFLILFQFIIGIGVAAYQFTESPSQIDEMRTDDNQIFDLNTADYVDVNTSDVDGGGSQGSHSDFPEMQATNDIYDTLTENEVVNPPLYNYVNNNSSDVDASSNLGSHYNFTAMQYGPDSTYDSITEVNTAGTVNTTFINAESFEGTWPPSGWTETPVDSRWDRESDQSYDGSYSADFDGSNFFYYGYLTCPSMDCSDASAIYVEFYFYDNGFDDSELWLQYYNGTNWNYIKDLNTAPYGSTEWHYYSDKITDTQYFVSDFQIRWRAYGIDRFESAHVDMVTLKKETPILPENYELNVEVQFTDVPDFLATETLCIYAGSFDTSEDIGVYEWDGSQWQFLGNLTASSWNNFTVSYLTSTNYTIKYQGWNETGDSEQSSWQIDATLLRLEGAGQNETAVENDTSDVDSAADVGTLTDFSNMTALDDNVATLTETVSSGSLNCTGGYMLIGYDGSVDWSSTAGTISFWVKFDNFGRPYGQDSDMELRFSGSNLVLDWGSDWTLTTATTFSTDTWYFIAIVWDQTSNDLLVYIGDEVTMPILDLESQQGNWYETLDDLYYPYYRNYFMRGIMSGGEPVDGLGQDLRYYDIARSQAAIQSDYKRQLTGSEPNLVNYYKLTNDFTDSAGTDDGSGVGSYSFVTDDSAPLTQLDQEVQWTGLPYQLPNEELCIYCGTLDDEDIQVDVWNGTGWENLFLDLTANSWNNVSIAGYLNSPTFTIRFRDGNTTGDITTQDSWEIDVALIHMWRETTVYKLDLEVQWINADFDEYYEELCIKTGAIEAEDISVDVWDGSQWQEVISDLNPTAWNNVSVKPYLTNPIFTIRFRGGSESSDLNQESWQIDAVLLHTWTPGDQEPPNISWGSNQFANGIGTDQVNIDIEAEDIYYGSGIDTVWYRIRNVSASEWVSGHNNVSLTSPNYETNVNVSNWHPLTEYYVEAFANDTGGYENSTQSITGDEYRFFTIVHTISVSTPTVSYTGGAIQELDITGVTATCSYAAHGELDYTVATVHNFTVYTSEGSPTGITGELVWTGGFWQAFDVDVSSLSDGNYYVQCSFEDSDATGTSPASNIFTKTTDTGGGDGNGSGDGGGDGGTSDGGKSLQIMILSIDYPSQIEKYSNVQIEIILTDGEGTLINGAEVTLIIDNGTEPLYLAVNEKEGYYTALLITDAIDRGNHTLIVIAQKTGFETLVSSAFSFKIRVSYPLLTIIQHPSYAPQVIKDPIQLLLDPTFYISISLILASVMIQKITLAPISTRKLRALYIFTVDGKCVYDRTFTVGGVESHLMTAALSGIISLIMEATSSEIPTRTVDQGNFDIILEYGRSFVIATFVEKRTFNTRKIRKGQRKLVKKIEEKYGVILKKWDGDLSYFQELDHLILDAFDFKVTQDLISWIKDAAKIHEELIAYYANHKQFQMVGKSLWKAYDLYKKIKSPKVPKILARWIAFGKAYMIDYIVPNTEVRNKILSIVFIFLDFVRTPFLLKAFHRIQSTLNPEILKNRIFSIDLTKKSTSEKTG